MVEPYYSDGLGELQGGRGEAWVGFCWCKLWRPGCGGDSKCGDFPLMAAVAAPLVGGSAGSAGSSSRKACLESASSVCNDSVHFLYPQLYPFPLKLASGQCYLQHRALTLRGRQGDTMEACWRKWRK